MAMVENGSRIWGMVEDVGVRDVAGKIEWDGGRVGTPTADDDDDGERSLSDIDYRMDGALNVPRTMATRPP